MSQNVKSHLVNVWGEILLIHIYSFEHQGSHENEKRSANFLKVKNSYCILYKIFFLHFGTNWNFDF
jgi:hypothetical protein